MADLWSQIMTEIVKMSLTWIDADRACWTEVCARAWCEIGVVVSQVISSGDCIREPSPPHGIARRQVLVGVSVARSMHQSLRRLRIAINQARSGASQAIGIIAAFELQLKCAGISPESRLLLAVSRNDVGVQPLDKIQPCMDDEEAI